VTRDVLVSLLEAIVLANVVQVVSADDNGAGHLVLDNDAGQNASTNRHVASERTLLVNVGASQGLSWSLEAQADISGVTAALSTLANQALLVKVDGGLFLK